jgi:hypothetical protein
VPIRGCNPPHHGHIGHDDQQRKPGNAVVRIVVEEREKHGRNDELQMTNDESDGGTYILFDIGCFVIRH